MNCLDGCTHCLEIDLKSDPPAVRCSCPKRYNAEVKTPLMWCAYFTRETKAAEPENVRQDSLFGHQRGLFDA